jgi:acetyl esterase/lipase
MTPPSPAPFCPVPDGTLRLDPELAEYLSTFSIGALTSQSLPALRQRMHPTIATNGQSAGTPAVSWSESWALATERGPKVRLLVYRPAAERNNHGAILHIHGGGYVMGSPEARHAHNIERCSTLDCVVVSVAYRLAPETAYPGPLEDCYTALRWMHDQCAALDIQPDKIIVSGESAGGGLAAALCLLVRDRAEMTLAFQHLTAPMLDDRTCCRPDPHPHTGEFIWTRDHNDFGWTAMLGTRPGADSISAYAAPGRATDLAGLPPAFISVGGLDLFLEETLDFGRRLSRAGVSVELHVYPGACHGFYALPSARVCRDENRISREALQRALAQPTSGS